MSYFVLALIAVALIWFVATYNGLISARNQAANALAGIDVNLKKRHDLIPNVVDTLKGYMKHEKELFTKVTELRALAMAADPSSSERFRTESDITGSLNQICIRAEAYPELKASDNFIHLQRTLTEIEEQVSASRRAYNSAVMSLNNSIEMFPSSIVAGAMSLRTYSFFEAKETERENVNVEL